MCACVRALRCVRFKNEIFHRAAKYQAFTCNHRIDFPHFPARICMYIYMYMHIYVYVQHLYINGFVAWIVLLHRICLRCIYIYVYMYMYIYIYIILVTWRQYAQNNCMLCCHVCRNKYVYELHVSGKAYIYIYIYYVWYDCIYVRLWCVRGICFSQDMYVGIYTRITLSQDMYMCIHMLT